MPPRNPMHASGPPALRAATDAAAAAAARISSLAWSRGGRLVVEVVASRCRHLMTPHPRLRATAMPMHFVWMRQAKEQRNSVAIIMQLDFDGRRWRLRPLCSEEKKEAKGTASEDPRPTAMSRKYGSLPGGTMSLAAPTLHLRCPLFTHWPSKGACRP